MNKLKLAIISINWKLPSNKKYVRREFNCALKKCGIKIDPFDIEIRSPQQNRYVAFHPSASKWHKDGANARYEIIWSNKLPTLIREFRTKRAVLIPSNAIVVFDNIYYRHKPDSKGKKSHSRWFIRSFITLSKLPKRFKTRIFIVK